MGLLGGVQKDGLGVYPVVYMAEVLKRLAKASSTAIMSELSFGHSTDTGGPKIYFKKLTRGGLRSKRWYVCDGSERDIKRRKVAAAGQP